MPEGAFTQRPRPIVRERETDKITTVPNGISVSVQYQHFHTIVCKSFFIGLSIGLGLFLV